MSCSTNLPSCRKEKRKNVKRKYLRNRALGCAHKMFGDIDQYVQVKPTASFMPCFTCSHTSRAARRKARVPPLTPVTLDHRCPGLDSTCPTCPLVLSMCGLVEITTNAMSLGAWQTVSGCYLWKDRCHTRDVTAVCLARSCWVTLNLEICLFSHITAHLTFLLCADPEIFFFPLHRHCI